MRIDLHLHTQYSDGDNTILEIAAVAAQRGFTVIAFTDHTDVQGNFLFNTRFGKRDFVSYLSEIQVARKMFPDLKIWCGIEISDSFGAIPDEVDSIYRACDIILVDGYTVNDPIHGAQRIQDWCEISHIFGKHVGVAHPKFEAFTPNDWDIVDRDKLFLELNNSKLHKTQINAIEAHFAQQKSKNLKWSVGSDAHSAGFMGDISIAWNIVEQFSLQEKLIVSSVLP